MPFVEANRKKENARLKKLLNDPQCKKIADEFDSEYEFRKELCEARKKEKISQKQLSEMIGMSQQMISRIETGWTDTTVGTLLRYLNGIGYSLSVVKNNK